MGLHTPPTRKELCSTRDPEQAREDFVTAWIVSAENDLTTGYAALAASMPSYETVSFHAQQGAEKALKALLVRHQVEFAKTHDIAALLALAERVAPGIAGTLAPAEVLSARAVESRYPSRGEAIGREEAGRDLQLGAEVLNHVRTRLAGR